MSLLHPKASTVECMVEYTERCIASEDGKFMAYIMGGINRRVAKLPFDGPERRKVLSLTHLAQMLAAPESPPNHVA